MESFTARLTRQLLFSRSQLYFVVPGEGLRSGDAFQESRNNESELTMKLVLITVFILAVPLILIMAVGAMLPKAHTVSRAIPLNAPPDAVWKLITSAPTWRPNITRYEELPANNGHRMWRETDKGGQTIAYEAMESDPPRHLVTRIADPSLPFGVTWNYEITRSGSGTTSTLTITEKGEFYNPVLRFVSRYIMGHAATVDAYLKAAKARLG